MRVEAVYEEENGEIEHSLLAGRVVLEIASHLIPSLGMQQLWMHFGRVFLAFQDKKACSSQRESNINLAHLKGYELM